MDHVVDASRDRVAVRWAASGVERPEGDVLSNRQMRKQREILEDEADAAAMGGYVVNPLAAKQDVAAVGFLKAGDEPQKRRLARAARRIGQPRCSD
jgi:hypothetical protein